MKANPASRVAHCVWPIHEESFLVKSKLNRSQDFRYLCVVIAEAFY